MWQQQPDAQTAVSLQLDNVAAVVAMLRKLPDISVTDVRDFEQLPMEAKLRLAADTDLLVGEIPHCVSVSLTPFFRPSWTSRVTCQNFSAGLAGDRGRVKG